MATVVQGVAVASPYDHGSSTEPSGSIQKGEKQPNRCRDPIFAVLFYIQLAIIAALAVIYGPAAFTTYKLNGVDADARGYVKIAGVTGVVSFILAGIMLLVMMSIAEFLIKVALIFEVLLSLAFAVFGFISGNIFGGVLGLIFFLIGACYARMVWSRIPFATANLVTSLTAVKANIGVSLVAYLFAILSVAWYMLWAVAFVGIYVKYTCDPDTQVCDASASPNGGVLFGLFLSYFFTTQVLQNCVHVTVAGTVGTWWFTPEDASCCCSSAVLGSTFRSLTTSFGSICFGSLIVAIIQALRQLAQSLRDDNGILACIIDCILACIENLIEYFNKWAYVYVGLYGYGYLEAGKSVFTLFKNRGWEAIIADDLVSNVLFLVSLVVGLITGGVGVGLLRGVPEWFSEIDANDPTSTGISFAFGLVVGLVVTSILMSVVGSGVNTVIVCFAEGPAEFQQNHPELSNKMRSTWQSAFPGSI